MRSVDRRPPLIGRDDELELMMGALGDALAGRGSLITISGEAGIGKTRLLEELVGKADMTGCQVLIGRSLPGTRYPLFPFHDAFSALEESPLRRGASRIGGEGPWVPSGGRRAQRAEARGGSAGIEGEMFATFEFLRAESQLKSMVLCLEDIHWADSASMQLIHFLARNIRRCRLLMVGTYRPEELVVCGEESPLGSALSMMRREGVVTEVRLRPLTTAEIGSAIDGYVGCRVDPMVSRRIADGSEGNPLFALESMRMLMDGGGWRMDEGQLELEGRLEFSIPETIVEVVLRRMETLSWQQRMVVDHASVLGTSFSFAALDGMCQGLEVALGPTVGSLVEQSNILSWDGPMHLRFGHDAVRRANYEAITAPRRKELHALAGRSLESANEEPTPGELALHFHEAGMAERSVDYSLQAGLACIRKSAAWEACTYLKWAFDDADGFPAFQGQRLQAKEGLGDALMELGRYDEAFGQFEELAREYSSSTDLARINRKCCECWSPGRLGESDSVEHAKYLERAMRYQDVDPEERGEILSDFGVIRLWEGDFDQAEEACLRSIEIFRTHGTMDRLAWELSLHGFILMAKGQPGKAMAELDEAFQILQDHPRPRVELILNQYRGEALMSLGRAEGAKERFAWSLEQARVLGDNFEAAWAHFYLALLHLMSGDLAEALFAADRSRGTALRLGSRGLMAMSNCILVHIYAIKNKHDLVGLMGQEIETILNERADARKGSPLPGLAGVASAEASLVEGKVQEADIRLNRAQDDLERAELGLFYQALGMEWMGELGLALGMRDMARSCFSQAHDKFIRLGNIPWAMRAKDELARDQVGMSF